MYKVSGRIDNTGEKGARAKRVEVTESGQKRADNGYFRSEHKPVFTNVILRYLSFSDWNALRRTCKLLNQWTNAGFSIHKDLVQEFQLKIFRPLIGYRSMEYTAILNRSEAVLTLAKRAEKHPIFNELVPVIKDWLELHMDGCESQKTTKFAKEFWTHVVGEGHKTEAANKRVYRNTVRGILAWHEGSNRLKDEENCEREAYYAQLTQRVVAEKMITTKLMALLVDVVLSNDPFEDLYNIRSRVYCFVHDCLEVGVVTEAQLDQVVDAILKHEDLEEQFRPYEACELIELGTKKRAFSDKSVNKLRDFIRDKNPSLELVKNTCRVFMEAYPDAKNIYNSN